MSSDLFDIATPLNSPDMVKVLKQNEMVEAEWANTPSYKNVLKRLVREITSPDEPAMKVVRLEESVTPFDAEWLKEIPEVPNTPEFSREISYALNQDFLSSSSSSDEESVTSTVEAEDDISIHSLDIPNKPQFT